MANWLHFRLAGWLTSALVAFWPVAAAQACCCTAGEKLSGDSNYRSSCCAAPSDSCCDSHSVTHAGICCATNAGRDACGCSQECGRGEPRQKLASTFEKSGPHPTAAFAGDGWLTMAWAAQNVPAGQWNAAVISQRPKRILYGVWRN